MPYLYLYYHNIKTLCSRHVSVTRGYQLEAQHIVTIYRQYVQQVCSHLFCCECDPECRSQVGFTSH